MQIEIRLKKVLHNYDLDHHGVTQRMARDLGVHRHSVGKLYRNQASNPSLDLLGMVCDWLQRNGVPAEELPQALFGSRPPELWQAVAAPGTVVLYLGERQQLQEPGAARLWISRRDAVVAEQLRDLLSGLGRGGAGAPAVRIRYVPFCFAPRARHVAGEHFRRDIERSRRIFDEMQSQGASQSSVLVGSQRVNYLVERFVAGVFGCEPFRPQGPQPAVPFYMKYREYDRGAPSCFGGHETPPGYEGPPVPGTYHLDESGRWRTCAWEENKEDCAAVVTTYDPGTKSVAMAVLGFSGRGTAAMGKQLSHNGNAFWPPTAEAGGMQVGVYICRVSFIEDTSGRGAGTVQVKDCEIIPIGEAALSQCLAR